MAGSLSRSWKLLDLGRTAFKLKNASSEQVAANARLALIEKMGRLRGLPQKLGQILSMGAGAQACDFQPLTNQAEPLPVSIIQAELKAAWGTNPDDVVSHLSERGLAASLGQVHSAYLRDDTKVAIKVRYPDIVHAVANDLNALGWLSVPLGGLKRGFDLGAYRTEILRDIEEELDYRTEAQRQIEFASLATEISFLIVPEVIAAWSCETVLVSRWEDGDDLQTVLRTWPASEKKALGRQIVKLFARSVLVHGLVHADPHVGNYRFRRNGENPKIVLYDFGSVLRLEETVRLALVRLIAAAMNDRDEDPYPLFLLLGFNADTLQSLRAKLPALCRVLLDPFCTNGPFATKTWKRGERVADVLGDDRWNFRISGPARLSFLMRAFHGLVYYLEQLGEPVNWNWQVAPIVESQRFQADTLPLPVSPDRTTTFRALARNLVICVTENGQTKVKVTLPALAVDELEEYLEGDLSGKIQARGIDLARIVKEVRHAGYAPRTLFKLEESPKSYHVWLE